MARFILGYHSSDQDFENLIEFSSVEDAQFNSEEWCTVDADTLEEAKANYDAAFLEHKENGRISGCF